MFVWYVFIIPVKKMSNIGWLVYKSTFTTRKWLLLKSCECGQLLLSLLLLNYEFWVLLTTWRISQYSAWKHDGCLSQLAHMLTDVSDLVSNQRYHPCTAHTPVFEPLFRHINTGSQRRLHQEDADRGKTEILYTTTSGISHLRAQRPSHMSLKRLIEHTLFRK